MNSRGSTAESSPHHSPCRTVLELARNHPIQAVTAWLGNTPKVALENYLQVRDEDFAAAIADPIETASLFCAAPALRNTSAKLGNGSHGFADENENPLFRRGNLQNKGFPKPT